MKGENFKILERRANWLKVSNEDFPIGYIWAQSCGFDKIELYQLRTWYDTENYGVYRLKQYYNLLGQPSEKAEYFGMMKLNFYDIGLGSEKEIMMDQDGKSEEVLVKKGVGLVLDDKDRVREIHIHLHKPIPEFRDIENLLEVELGAPDRVVETHISWFKRYNIPEIQLLRTEFKSENFHQIILMF